MLCGNTQLFPSFISERQLEKKPLCNSSSGGSASLNELQLARHSNFLWNSGLNPAPRGSAAWRDCHGNHYLCREKPTGCFQGKLHRNVTLAALDKNNTPPMIQSYGRLVKLVFFCFDLKVSGDDLVHSSLESFSFVITQANGWSLNMCLFAFHSELRFMVSTLIHSSPFTFFWCKISMAWSHTNESYIPQSHRRK